MIDIFAQEYGDWQQSGERRQRKNVARRIYARMRFYLTRDGTARARRRQLPGFVIVWVSYLK
jgi:hypothetical protein